MNAPGGRARTIAALVERLAARETITERLSSSNNLFEWTASFLVDHNPIRRATS
jgi:hypothetical protein